MTGFTTVTKNEYFTYLKDGDSEYTFRDSDQIWNYTYKGVAYEIHVSGPNKQPAFVGQYNCFAKKHLMTIKGGKSSDLNYERGLASKAGEKRSKFSGANFDSTIRGKLYKVHEKRTNSDPWATDERFVGYGDKRSDKRDEMHPDSQAHYRLTALGGAGIGEQIPLTIVLCDLLTPDDLKDSFAAAISAAKGAAGAGTVLQHVRVRFPTRCVYQHRSSDNDFDVGNTIQVSIYLHAVAPKKIEAHVVHCSGV